MPVCKAFLSVTGLKKLEGKFSADVISTALLNSMDLYQFRDTWDLTPLLYLVTLTVISNCQVCIAVFRQVTPLNSANNFSSSKSCASNCLSFMIKPKPWKQMIFSYLCSSLCPEEHQHCLETLKHNYPLCEDNCSWGKYNNHFILI